MYKASGLIPALQKHQQTQISHTNKAWKIIATSILTGELRTWVPGKYVLKWTWYCCFLWICKRWQHFWSGSHRNWGVPVLNQLGGKGCLTYKYSRCGRPIKASSLITSKELDVNNLPRESTQWEQWNCRPVDLHCFHLSERQVEHDMDKWRFSVVFL